MARVEVAKPVTLGLCIQDGRIYLTRTEGEGSPVFFAVCKMTSCGMFVHASACFAELRSERAEFPNASREECVKIAKRLRVRIG